MIFILGFIALTLIFMYLLHSVKSLSIIYLRDRYIAVLVVMYLFFLTVFGLSSLYHMYLKLRILWGY